MNQRILVFELALIGLGGVLLWIGILLSQPDLNGLGKSLVFVGIGIFSLVGGIQALITRKLEKEVIRPGGALRKVYVVEADADRLLTGSSAV